MEGAVATPPPPALVDCAPRSITRHECAYKCWAGGVLPRDVRDPPSVRLAVREGRVRLAGVEAACGHAVHLHRLLCNMLCCTFVQVHGGAESAAGGCHPGWRSTYQARKTNKTKLPLA